MPPASPSRAVALSSSTIVPVLAASAGSPSAASPTGRSVRGARKHVGSGVRSIAAASRWPRSRPSAATTTQSSLGNGNAATDWGIDGSPQRAAVERVGAILAGKADRQIAWLLALEDAIDIGCCLPVRLEHLNPIGHQAA